MTKTLLATPVWVLALVMAVTGCGRMEAKGDKKKEDGTAAAVPVEVAALRRGPIESTWKSSTSLAAEEEVKVYARSANRVTELLVEEGDEVNKGDLLLELESETQKIAMDKARSSYEKGQEDFLRQERLFQQGLISVELFNESKYNLRQLELTLADATREFNYTKVHAPISGTITLRMVKFGDYVTMNQHLFDMVDFKSIVARVYPPENFLNRISLRQAARVRSPSLDDALYPAYVKRVAPVVEGRTGTFKVTLGFEDVRNLRPGLYVDTEIVLATYDDALLIPKRAMVYDGDQTFVYRLLPDERVERLLLEAELSDHENVTPTGGFSEGDRIVVAGQTGLKDGAKVRVTGEPEPEKKPEDTLKESLLREGSKPVARSH